MRSLAWGTALGGAVLAGCIAAGAANATPLVQAVNGLAQNFGDFTPFDINFLPFDPAQGALQSVTIELMGTVVPELFSDNMSKATTVTLSTRLFMFAASNGVSTTQNVNLPSQTGVVGVASNPPNTTRFQGAPISVDSTFTFTDAADFLGTSPTPITLAEYGFRTSAAPALSGSGSDTTSFNGRAIVTYTLATPVPEPLSILLFGAGLLGLGLNRRRAA